MSTSNRLILDQDDIDEACDAADTEELAAGIRHVLENLRITPSMAMRWRNYQQRRRAGHLTHVQAGFMELSIVKHLAPLFEPYHAVHEVRPAESLVLKRIHEAAYPDTATRPKMITRRD